MTQTEKQETWEFFKKPINIIKYGIPSILFALSFVTGIVKGTQWNDNIVNAISKHDDKLNRHEIRLDKVEEVVNSNTQRLNHHDDELANHEKDLNYLRNKPQRYR